MASKTDTPSLKGGLTWGLTAGAYQNRDKPVAKALDKELYGEGLLGESLGDKAKNALSEKFGIPPFSVMNAREGEWQTRKRAWIALGIHSELGRGDDGTTGAASYKAQDSLNALMKGGKVNTASNPPNAADGTLLIDKYRGKTTKQPTLARETAPVPTSAEPTVPVELPIPSAEDMDRSRLPDSVFAMPMILVVEPAVPRAEEVVVSGPLSGRPPAAAKKGPPPGGVGFIMPTISLTAPEAAKPAKAAARARSVGVANPMTAPPVTWVAPTDLPRLRGAKRIGIDTETYDPDLTTLGPGVRRGSYIVGISVARDDGGKWYLPMRHEGGGNLDPGMVERWARDELNGYDGEVVGAKIDYDMDHLAEIGVTFPNARRWRDVQLAEPLIDENKLVYSLDSLGIEYLGRHKNEELLKTAAAAYGFGATGNEIKRNLWRLPAGYVGAYAEDDADLPLNILPLQEAKLAAEDLTDLFDLESRLTPILLAMRRRGVRMDLSKVERVGKVLDGEIAKWLAVVRRFTGSKGELMAADSLAPALEARGLTVPKTPKTEKPSIAKGFFAKYKGDELVDAIAAGRRVNTLKTMFVDGHIEGHVINGRIHCTYNQLKSDDGGTIARLSASDPNLQNIPSRKNDLDDDLNLGEDVVKLIRGMFVPEEGEKWERHDLSQIEYRFLTHFAVGTGADEARAAYNNDPKTDFHKLCAAIAGIDPDDAVKRKGVKGLNFMKVYGGGADRAAILLNSSKEEAVKFISEYDRKLPFVKATLDKSSESAAKFGYALTILKRRGRFDMWEPTGYGHNKPPLPYDKAVGAYGTSIKRYRTYAALSRKLQGSAADHLKKGLVDIWESGVCDVIGAPLITVHDENDWSRNDSPEHLEAVAEARRLLEQAITLKVPVMAETDIGADWGATS